MLSHAAAAAGVGAKSKVAVCQLTCTADKDANFAVCRSLVERAKASGAEMVFFPENTDFVSESKEQTLLLAEALDGPFVSRFKELAQQLGIWLSIGGFHEKTAEEQRIRNTQLLINSNGAVCAKYTKAHLFCVDIPGKVKINEADGCIPGDEIVSPVITPAGKLGMAICYDLRFPEMSTLLRSLGAEILIYPSAFTRPTGEAHWEVLLRCRAIENQCYVIAAAQTGVHNSKRASHGHSMIIDPWGRVLQEIKDGVDVAVAEVDLEYLHRVRAEMPVQQHRRHDLYSLAMRSPAVQSLAIDALPTYTFGHVSIKPSAVFYRSQLSFAFVNISPVVPGHVLVSPLRVTQRFSELTAAELADLFGVVSKLVVALEKHYCCSSATISVQDGTEAGQTVQHVHVHVLPRKEGDFKRNDEIYEKLQSHDKDASKESSSDADRSRLRRSDEAMAREAEALRNYFY